ncbi:MAG TPA: helix-turn-helix transcriptional regulator [Tepidisphaeraceae bacterium]|jgi:DNA-binding XRE family transcriptional regulator|nr:helix-turn-helix transcriptional regulator [Tepidisphaeraceae bacterium]
METIEKNGMTYALVPLETWNRIARSEMPELPPADALGNRNAVAFARVSIARTIIRDRLAAGLSQSQLAAAAGITRQVLNRIERAKVTADEATINKIDRALRAHVKRQMRGAKKQPSA